MKSAAPGSMNETRIDCEYMIRVSSLQCKLSFLTVFERLQGALILLIGNFTVSQVAGDLSIQSHMDGRAEQCISYSSMLGSFSIRSTDLVDVNMSIL